MLSFFKNHPFAVDAFFKSSLVLSFALPKEELEKYIPACLQLDTFNDRWAFVAMAMVQTNKLRPKGFPAFMGNDFFLIGYRVFVRYNNREGKNLRGLYILKSETDKMKMQIMGNLFTHYHYTTTDILQQENDVMRTISSVQSKFKITIDKTDTPVQLPAGSPFADWKEARRFAGPLPFTFTYNPATKEVLIIEGVRENWKPVPVHVINYEIDFLQSLATDTPILANAFIVNNISYHWKKGRKEIWQ